MSHHPPGPADLMAIALAGVLGWLAALPAAAQPSAGPSEATALHTQALAASCAACHGTGGRALPQSPVPGLAGMPREVFVAQMAAFRSGQREATVMHQIARGYSEAQIARLAAHFAAQPR